MSLAWVFNIQCRRSRREQLTTPVETRPLTEDWNISIFFSTWTVIHQVIYCIHSGGSRGRTQRPPRVLILSFWHTNFTKHSCVWSWCPPTRWAPPWEILDPPLILNCFFYSTVFLQRENIFSPNHVTSWLWRENLNVTQITSHRNSLQSIIVWITI